MITMTYSCMCGWESGLLDEAQSHANEFRKTLDQVKHRVKISGFITSNVTSSPVVSIEERAADRAREAEILRRARERGFVPQKGRK